MINYQDIQNIQNVLSDEKELIIDFQLYESKIKLALEKYIKEFDKITFENEVIKVMILNNFDNAIMQIDNNLQDIESLNNVLDILQNQENISDSDIETYNKLFEKVEKDIKLIQSFIQKSIKSFDNVSYTGTKKSLSVLDKCKKTFSLDIPTNTKNNKKNTQVKKSKKEQDITPIFLKREFDVNSSDLLCFFPKNESENLVISTVQDNYQISFRENQATIYIKEENFHISIHTSGVQFSNLKSNNILFVSRKSSKYRIITNNQIEIPSFVQVSKISKNEDFLEVELAVNSLFLSVQDNIVYFDQEGLQDNLNQEEHKIKPEPEKEKEKQQELEIDTKPEKEISQNTTLENVNSKQSAKEPINNLPKKEDTSSNAVINDEEITDNNTLIISDSSQQVILPYSIEDLEEKMKKNKKYKSLQDVIKNEYTIPLDTFKNPVKSRFREAFQLIKKKEHGSLKEAIGLGFELMFQSDLNPAVIAACRDLDELDIYLDCLDDNELDKFSCFKIEYNVKPTKNSKR